MNTFLIIIAVIFVIAAVLLCLYVGVFGVLMYLLDEMMSFPFFWLSWELQRHATEGERLAGLGILSGTGLLR